MCQVLKQLKQFQYNAIQQAINISKSLRYYNFMSNRYYAYLLNVESENLVFLKTYNTVFYKITIKFIYQNDRLLEIKDKVNLILLINKQKWTVILENLGERNTSKDMDFCHLREIYLRNMEKKLFHTARKTGLHTAKSASKKVI